MRAAKIYLADGTNYTTSINGTDAEIREYFRVGSPLNIGRGPDDYIVKITKVQIDNEITTK